MPIFTLSSLLPQNLTTDRPRFSCCSPTSFGIVCFEVATRVEPFKGKKPAQVMRAVLAKEERPEVPEWASVSPDVVPLMEHCWMQDPAQRPEGFVPVVRTLALAVRRAGDPRSHTSGAADVAFSPAAKRSGGAPSTAASTAPLTVSGSLGAPLLERMPVGGLSSATAPAPPTRRHGNRDRAALLELYSATNGPPDKHKNGGWEKRHGWGTSRPISEWYGVTVDDEDRVIKLELADNSLNGEVYHTF